MLSYKEYKLLNESLYGAMNLGIKSHGIVGGIVSDSQVNGTEAAIEAESEEAMAEAKKAKKAKKKMDSDMDVEEEPKDELKKKKPVEDEDSEDEDEDEEEDSEDEDEDEDSEDEDEDEDSEDEGDEEKAVEKKPMFMKKRAKKEWSEVVSDLESILEDISDEEALAEIRKGLQTISEGMKKGSKKHKEGCDCFICSKKNDDKGDEGDKKGHAKNHKSDCDCPLCKNSKGKKCGKYMNEEDQAWWNSVNSMLGADANQKNWDGGWSEVGEVQQAVRENAEIKKKVVVENQDLRGGGISRMNLMTGGDGKRHEVRPGDTWESICRKYYGDGTRSTALYDFNSKYYKNMGSDIGVMSTGTLKPGMTVYIPDSDHFDDIFDRI